MEDEKGGYPSSLQSLFGKLQEYQKLAIISLHSQPRVTLDSSLNRLSIFRCDILIDRTDDTKHRVAERPFAGMVFHLTMQVPVSNRTRT